MAQLPQPSQLLHGVRSKKDSVTSYFRLDRVIVNSTHKDIQTAVANAWNEERKNLVRQVSVHLQKASIASEDAVKYAEEFVSALEEVNGQQPTEFPPIGQVNCRVSALISKFPSEAQQILLEYEEKYGWYSKYAYNFMQVRIQPIDVKVGSEVPNSVLDWRFTNLKMVTSSISLPKLVEVRLTDLQKCFKSLVLDKSKHFAEGMKISSEISYMIKACNILVHKMFERHGIDLTGKSPEKIREGVLGDVKYCHKLKDFSAIDSALGNLVSFLSNTYISF